MRLAALALLVAACAAHSLREPAECPKACAARGGNGECDPKCFVAHCEWDRGDCAQERMWHSWQTQCSDRCDTSGQAQACETACATPSCKFHGCANATAPADDVPAFLKWRDAFLGAASPACPGLTDEWCAKADSCTLAENGHCQGASHQETPAPKEVLVGKVAALLITSAMGGVLLLVCAFKCREDEALDEDENDVGKFMHRVRLYSEASESVHSVESGSSLYEE